MSDLRTGLVEAIAQALHASVDTSAAVPWDELDWRTQVRWLNRGTLALDTTLGFLTDNAPYVPVPLYTVDLIAVLSDSRDTGEKP